MALPGGGTRTDYDLPDDGGVTSLYTPPADFDPATASAARLAEYQLPAAPTGEGLIAMGGWQAQVAGWKMPAVAPAFLVQGTASADSQDNNIWGGYIASTGSFVEADMSWTEPSYRSSFCASNSAAIWAGIGGYNNPDLGQDGSIHGAGNTVPFPSDHQMWEEVLPQQAYTVPLPVTGAPGDAMTATVQWNSSGSDYSGVVSNGTTYQPWSHAGTYDGGTAEAIVERPTYPSGISNLSNFGTLQVTGSHANCEAMNQFSAYNPVQRSGLSIVSNTTGNLLAYPDTVSNDGSFTVTQTSCQ